MSKLINRESLKRSLVKTKSYIDNKLETIRETIQSILDNTPDESLSLESSNAISNKTVTEEINKINTALDVIQGEDEGSIKKEVSKGIASIVDSAPDTLDTLKEVADWIKQDETNSAQIIEDLNSIPITTGEGDKSIVLKGTETSNVASAHGATIIGANNIVENRFSIAVGTSNYVKGEDSIAVGMSNFISEDAACSLACGTAINVINPYESGFGKYNNPKEGLLFSIGCGADNNNRKNAFEVREDGYVYIAGSPDISLNNHVGIRSAYFPELGSSMPISTCTPVILYYTKEGLFSEETKTTRVEVWRINRIFAVFNAPVFVKCFGFIDDDDAIHLAHFSAVCLCSDIFGVHHLTWESSDYKYEYVCGTHDITYTPKNPPEEEYLKSPALLEFNRAIPTTLYDSATDNFKLFDIQNNRVYPYAIYEGKQLIRLDNSVGVYFAGGIAKVTVHNGIVGDLSDSF